MNALSKIKTRFAKALSQWEQDPEELKKLLGMIRPAGNPDHGDYQANCAMPLGKKAGKSPRDLAAEIVDAVQLDDFCQSVEIAGPGFINLKLDDEWVKRKLTIALGEDRLGVDKVSESKTYVVDYSSPNVAKPMHVGHIRSTVIGDAITKVLRFVGHEAISDNHLGDWGTQFGMIIYGYKHFVDKAAYESSPINELARLYKHVRKLMDYHSAVKKLPESEQQLTEARNVLSEIEGKAEPKEKSEKKKHKKALKRAGDRVKEINESIKGLTSTVQTVEANSNLKSDADQHPEIGEAVLAETAKLHEGDKENKKLWEEFVPHCLDDINRIYDRLGISFDQVLGEAFYHPQLATVVNDLEAKGFTRESDGAICVFLDGHDTPMIVQKKDGAFLYSTTDLATIKYRVDHFKADAMLYVVDHRQSEHFGKLFDVARMWGYREPELKHVSFGTVMGKDGKPFKTRSGDTVGLEGVLDEAESRALAIVTEKNPDLDEAYQKTVANVVGIGGLRYADLSHNRESDYVFDYEKMLALKGNTAAYSQYGYARVQGIMRKADIDPAELRVNPVAFEFKEPVERKLAIKLIQFGETLDEVLVDYKPNVLCTYLFELGQIFAQFFDQCSVKDAETDALKHSRIQLCDITARTIKTALGLLGIKVLDKM